MSHRLARILLAAFLGTMVAQQSNLGSLVFGDECPESCPDDASPHRCPLGCTECRCVGSGHPVSLAPLVPAMAHPGAARVERDAPATLPEPHSDPIFHVPRPTLV